MLRISRIAFAMILITSLPALGADPARVADPENFCMEVLNAISSGKPSDAANLIATTIGRADSAGELLKFLKILEDKNFDFTKKRSSTRITTTPFARSFFIPTSRISASFIFVSISK